MTEFHFTPPERLALLARWADRPLRVIVDHLEQHEHPQLRQLASEICSRVKEASMAERPELDQLCVAGRVLEGFLEELEEHYREEEEKLFPLLRPLDEAGTQTSDDDASLREALALITSTHNQAVDHVIGLQARILLDRLEENEDRPLLPAIGAPLRQFLAVLREHIALEEDILRPRAEAALKR